VNLLERPSGGSIAFAGRRLEFDATVAVPRASLRALRTRVGMVFQSYNLWPHMTVLENIVEAPLRVAGRARAEAVAEAEALLERIGLADKRGAYPSRLSGGQQQRVAIARALAMHPQLMLFDEVTSALDPELVGEVLELMGSLAAEGMTMLVVTHEIAFARAVSRRTVFIDRGRIAAEGPSGSLLSRPGNDRLSAFLRRILHEPRPLPAGG
jgi:polar amino acid transport system ATP-binding protein